MAGNIGNIGKVKVAGPQRITLGGQTLGHTLDGVTFNYERSFTDVYVDQYGETSVDKVLMGQNVNVVFQMAETDWVNWNAAVPETSSQSSTYARTDLGADAGASLRAEALQMVIHPTRLLDTDTSEDITLYKAVSVENIEVVLKNDEQKVIEVTFAALVDESYGPGRRLGHIGSAAVS